MNFTIETLRVIRDARGSLFEPMDDTSLPAQRNVHVVLTQPGCVRGNYYHVRTTEVMTVCGPARVRIREGQATQDYLVPTDGVHRFTLPPEVAHAIKNTGPTPNLLISFTDRPHDPQKPDVVREVLI